MRTLAGEKVRSELQPSSAVSGEVVDQRAAEDALLATVRDYIDRNGLEPEFFNEMWEDSQRNGTDQMTLEEINKVIRAFRADRANRKQ